MRGNRAEVRAVLPAIGSILHQAQIRLVDERRGLQRLARLLPANVAGGQPPKLLINERQKGIERLPLFTHQPTRSMRTLFITTGLTGRSLRGRQGADLLHDIEALDDFTEHRVTVVEMRRRTERMKNWLPLVFGPALAIDRIPLVVSAAPD